MTLTKDAGSYRVATNGLPESAIDPPETPSTRYSEVNWLSILPAEASLPLDGVPVVQADG